MNVPKLRFKEFSDEWCETTLGETATFKQGIQVDVDKQFLKPFDNSVRFIRIVDYTQNTKDIRYISKPANANYVDEHDVVLVRYGATAGFVGHGIKGVIANNMFTVTPNSNINKDFLYTILKQDKIYNKLNSSNGSSAMPALNFGSVSILKFSYPSIDEQNKLTNLINLLDKKIELQTKKIEDLKLFKLYTKNQIFNDYDKVFKLKDILVKWNKKNKNNSVKYVESISNKYGFISQSDQFEDRNVASKNLNNYYIIEKGVFGYNPSRLNVGSLALKTNDKISVVSPLYECFTTSQNNQYLLEWFDSKYFRKETISKFEGGVRNTLNFSNLCEIEIRLPIIEKQNKYSNIFRMFNNKIELEVKKLYKLQELKKGLMQNMFV